MSKMFGVTIIKSPFAQSRLYLSDNAQKKFCINFECYYLTNGKDRMPEILNSVCDSS